MILTRVRNSKATINNKVRAIEQVFVLNPVNILDLTYDYSNI